MESNFVGKDFLVRRIEEAEVYSRELSISNASFASWIKTLSAFGQKFLRLVDEGPAYCPVTEPKGLQGVLPENGESFREVLREFWNGVLGNGVQTTSGRFFGYVPGGGVPTAAFADFVAALTNRYSGMYGASPGAAEIHNTCIRWLREMVGFPKESWGTLQSGGSLATLTALVAARQTRPFEQWPKSAIYLTAESHHAISKAIHISGLGCAVVHVVPTDPQYRMEIAALRSLMDEDRAQGITPWIVCATAGTTNTGAIDPLVELCALRDEQKIWLHVDAAYGGFFVLSETAKSALAGMSGADSLVLDPHKGLFQPYGCGAVLVRQSEWLRQSMTFQASYMQDLVEGKEGSPAEYSPELTRHFRSLRLWVSLKVYGMRRYRAALEEKILLARYLYHELSEVAGIEVGPEPQLSCVTFRAHGDVAHANQATQRMLQTILSRGNVHLSSTRLGEYDYLRVCILSFRSHMAEVDWVLREIHHTL